MQAASSSSPFCGSSYFGESMTVQLTEAAFGLIVDGPSSTHSSRSPFALADVERTTLAGTEWGRTPLTHGDPDNEVRPNERTARQFCWRACYPAMNDHRCRARPIFKWGSLVRLVSWPA